MIKVNIDSAYPSTDAAYSHELDRNGSDIRKVAFYKNDQPLDITSNNITVTATFVTNGCLVAEDVECEKITSTINAVRVDISSTDDYDMLPGVMLVEFQIKTSDNGVDSLLYPSCAMVVHKRESIRNNAQVTPESYGTVSEILQEVAEARGTFNSLDGRLDNIEVDVESVTQTADNLETEVTNARGTYTDVDARFDADEAQLNAILPIDYSKLRSDLQQVISGKQIHVEATVSDLDDSTFKSYIDAKTLYFLKFTGLAATALDGHGSGIMTVIPNSGTTVKREIVFPTSTNEKYVQNVTLGTPNTYSAWNKVQTIDLNTVPNITVWDYSTSETNNFIVPTSFEGKLGDKVVVTIGTGNGGKIFTLTRIISGVGSTSYYWEENVTFDNIPKQLYRVADLQTISTVAALNALSFLNVNTVYPIKLTGSAALAFEVDSDTIVELRVLPLSTGNTSTAYMLKQVLTIPEVEGVTWLQNVTKLEQQSEPTYWSWEKAYTPSAKTITSGSTVALEDNTEYAGTNINSLTLTYPNGEFECYLTLTFASSGTITVTLPTSSYIGSVPEFDNGETWEISIKNGVIVAGKVTSGS